MGYDAGKKIKGKKRHILVDTQGLLMHAIVHGADVQDRDGGVLLMATLFGLYPFLMKLYADGGYQGAQFQDALEAILKRVNVEIVKRSDQAQRFVVLPKRWIVERTFAWLGRCRRLAKDRECLNRKALAFLKPRFYPPHDTKIMQFKMMFPDRLLDFGGLFENNRNDRVQSQLGNG